MALSFAFRIDSGFSGSKPVTCTVVLSLSLLSSSSMVGPSYQGVEKAPTISGGTAASAATDSVPVDGGAAAAATLRFLHP